MTETLMLPALDNPHDLAPQAVVDYQRDGHVAVRGLATEEIGAYGPVIRDAALRLSTEDRPLEERDTYGKAFLQIENIWRQDEAVRRFTFAKRFAKVAADLMGVRAVRLYHDQALFKEAGGGATPFHQDHYYWPLDTEHMITMWMPLVDIPPEIGSMTFASGSHRLGYLGSYEISDESEAVFRTMVAERNIPLHTHGAMAAGDATFHAGWTLHSAPANPTGTLRAVMTVIYFADGVRAMEPETPGQHADLAAWLPGVQPGQLAVSELNPMLYSSPA